MADSNFTTTTNNVPLYIPTLPSIPAAFSHLLSTYSHIPTDQQPTHILSLRNRAYSTHPYPCLGRWRFLDLDLSVHPLYPKIVELLSEPTGPLFLDLGCCLAQDIRKLLSDLLDPGIGKQLNQNETSTRVFGADLRPEFIDIGYDLFLDRATFPASQFIAPADVFDLSPEAPLAKLDGKVGVLNCTAVFHLFGLDEQKKVAERCLRLLRREGIGGETGKKALILGSQTANVVAGEHPRGSGRGLRYRHNDDSWREMWEGVIKGEGWRDVVKSVEVGSELQERSTESKGRDAIGLGKVGSAVVGAGEEERRKMIERLEEGFRWQVWWVWVDFD